MSTFQLRASSIAVAIGLCAILAAGCVATGGGYGGGGYGGGGEVGLGVDYFEPFGGDYGGWGGGYGVAPYRGGGHPMGGGYGGGGHQAVSHSYRPAPASHGAPSLPSHMRSGGTIRH